MDNLEPGEGYRFIDTAVDEPQEGDEYYDPESERWFVRWSSKSHFINDTIYRRKINA